jgi:hypothetical protein
MMQCPPPPPGGEGRLDLGDRLRLCCASGAEGRPPSSLHQLGSFLRCLRKCLFKFNEWPRKRSLVFVTTMEALHTAGLAILCYLVLPRHCSH